MLQLQDPLQGLLVQILAVPFQRDGSEPGGCSLFTSLLHRHLLGLGHGGLQCISLFRSVRSWKRSLISLWVRTAYAAWGWALPMSDRHSISEIETLTFLTNSSANGLHPRCLWPCVVMLTPVPSNCASGVGRCSGLTTGHACLARVGVMSKWTAACPTIPAA